MAQQQEADISDAKNEISDLGTESQDTKQELKLQNCAERGTAGLDVEKLYHHHLYHQRLPTAATSATCVASLHYPLGSQKQDERAGRSKSQFFKGIQDGVPRTARGSAQERGHTGSLLKLYGPTKAII